MDIAHILYGLPTLARESVSCRAPERGRERVDGVPRSPLPDPGVKQNRQARQGGPPSTGCRPYPGAAPPTRAPRRAPPLWPAAGFIRTVLPTGCSEPAETLLGQHLPVGPPGMQATMTVSSSRRSKLSSSLPDEPIRTSIKQLRVLCIHAGDQRGQLRPRDVVADAMVSRRRALAKTISAIVDLQKLSGMCKEGGTLRRQFPRAEVFARGAGSPACLQEFELLADPCLGGLHDLCCTREAAQLSDANEGMNGIEIQGAINHDKRLLLTYSS
ncbi:hypothetical protein DdX_21703 [Ditylenchus destructor]|uniref:Uncharacterized protein n=1 Tax=Ditylenchus destructor TaxID=166010 RepID=A0AAD4QVC1_9BILA|nr:hypothetical protein DdX_21703 [Ditylenchus destructor]